MFALAAVAALMATTFKVSFPTDPLGPRAFPFVASLMLAIGALSLFRRDEAPPQWPDRRSALRIGAALLSFVAYALLLAPLGFVVSTALVFAALAVLFGGGSKVSSAAGLGAALILYAIFVYGLGLPLPLGSVFS